MKFSRITWYFNKILLLLHTWHMAQCIHYTDMVHGRLALSSWMQNVCKNDTSSWMLPTVQLILFRKIFWPNIFTVQANAKLRGRASMTSTHLVFQHCPILSFRFYHPYAGASFDKATPFPQIFEKAFCWRWKYEKPKVRQRFQLSIYAPFNDTIKSGSTC